MIRLSPDKQNGFTLVEVLIALSIFALIGISAYRVLETVILSQQSIASHSGNLRQIQRAMLLISLDIEQAVNRSIRGAYDDEELSMQSGKGEYLLEFTRQGWRNPLKAPRSSMLRVAYKLGSAVDEDENEGLGLTLYRHYWSVLDRAQDTEPKTQRLLRDVVDVQFRFLDGGGEWRTEWPFNQIGDTPVILPVAVEVLLETERFGEFRRTYQLGRVQGSGK